MEGGLGTGARDGAVCEPGSHGLYASFRAHALAAPRQMALVHGDRRVRAGELLAAADAVAADLARANARWYVAGDSRRIVDFVTNLLGGLAARVPVVVAATDPRIDASVAPDLGHPARLPADLACVLYTSGTNGAPTGVMTTERSYVINARDMARMLPLVAGDTALVCSPLHTSYGLSLGVMMPLALGMTIHATDYHHPRVLLRQIAALERCVLVASPAVYRGLLQCPEFLAPASLKLCCSSGDALPLAVARRYAELGVQVYDCYGSTETNGIAIALEPGSGELTPFPSVSVRLDNTDDRDEGELCVAGPKIMLGYLGDPTRTKMRLADGWIGTRDWGSFGPSGLLRLLGRLSSLIKVGGMRVHAEEVEHALESLDGIDDALAYGVDDAEHGEVVAAAITLSAASPPPSTAAILAALAGRLPAYMVPRRLDFVSEIPRSGGKKRREIRRLVRG